MTSLCLQRIFNTRNVINVLTHKEDLFVETVTPYDLWNVICIESY